MNNSYSTHKFICHCYPEDEAGKRVFIKEVDLQGGDALVMIGPEGDFSLEEVQMARELGFTTLSLGPMRLRTETAAMLAGMMLRMQSLWGSSYSLSNNHFSAIIIRIGKTALSGAN